MHEYLKEKQPPFVDISTQFTGTGTLLIKGESLFRFIEDKFSLKSTELPIAAYTHATNFYIQNLYNSGFTSITIVFFEDLECIYAKCIKECIKAILKDINFVKMHEFNEERFFNFLEEERIGLAVGYSDPESLRFVEMCIFNEVYCGLLDQMEFRIPNVYMFVYSPVFEKSTAEEEVLQNINKLTLSKPQCPHECLCKKVEKECKEIMHKLEEGESINKLFSTPCIEESEPSVFSSQYREMPILPSKNKELDILIATKKSSKPRNIQQYTLYLKKAATSLFGERLLYNPIGKVLHKKEVKSKISQKQKAFIEENEKRLETERKKKEAEFLRLFFNRYKAQDTEGKKRLLEGLYSESKEVRKKVLLLKIEFYYEQWALEKRKEVINEGVLVPCYLSCLEFIENYVSPKADPILLRELTFVFQKLIDMGFESTAHELLHKHTLTLTLTFQTSATLKPNDLDIYFQMKFAGDKLKRSFNSRPDKRVLFEPDDWQITLLDLVDQNKSAVISAPTSSGKTFICFYAIEKVLRESDDGIVIFCLPTKALVNQVAADVYARFNTKIYTKRDMVLQGILMKDYQVDPFNCQVLITVPHMLESLLNTNPLPKKDYLKRIKYIIIDEVHKISSEEMGVPIERIIHLSPSPILVLSATLGNLIGFYTWMKSIEALKNRDCSLVIHRERYCELKPYTYKAIPSPTITPINSLFAYSYHHIKEHGFSNDLNFLPDELLSVYYSIFSVLRKEQRKIIKELRPCNFFKSNIISKKDVKDYERFLIDRLYTWIKEGVLDEEQVKEIYNCLTSETLSAFESTGSRDTCSHSFILDNILPLLTSLKSNSLLPCIVFNTDRNFINSLAKTVYEQLEVQEALESVDKAEQRKREKLLKESKRNRDEKKREDAWIGETIQEEENVSLLREEKKNIKFCFFDAMDRVSDYEMEEYLAPLKKKNIEPFFLDMLYRGIGVHHNGMNKKYRELVEILFRRKHLSVVFSTETLSLGINMPCRSVVFAGDSVSLDPLNYRQMAGRAGRRGFDTLGHVVFLGVCKSKIRNLMVSCIPNLRGSYSYLNTSLLTQSSIQDLQSKEYLLSLIKYPLFAMNYECYGINSFFKSESNRHTLILSQIALLERHGFVFHNTLTSLTDIILSLKNIDPCIFVLLIILSRYPSNLEPHSFITLIAHFIEVKPVLFGTKNILPPLQKEVADLCNSLNAEYLSSIQKIYSEDLKYLQSLTKDPLLKCDSYFCTSLTKKSSYLLDFFTHGKVEMIMEDSCVDAGELFRSCSVVDTLLLSLVRFYEEYGDDGVRKGLNFVLESYRYKFKPIHA